MQMGDAPKVIFPIEETARAMTVGRAKIVALAKIAHPVTIEELGRIARPVKIEDHVKIEDLARTEDHVKIVAHATNRLKGPVAMAVTPVGNAGKKSGVINEVNGKKEGSANVLPHSHSHREWRRQNWATCLMQRHWPI